MIYQDIKPILSKLGYKFPKKLGTGGTGSTFKVYDIKRNKDIVIKIQNEETSIEDIKKEFKFAKSLTHPSIIKVYEFGKLEDKRGYYTMEYVDGTSFSWDGRNFETLVELIILICQALLYIHSKGIVHCDIKPSNVLIKNKQIKLMDFGLAHYGNILSNKFKGTIEYVAPELITGITVDRRADIYSLGIMLYEAITKRLPFEGDTPISILQKHLETQPEKLSKYRKDIPENLEKMILKMIAKSPENRFSEVQEILKELGWKGKLSIPIDERSLLLKSNFVGREKEIKEISDSIKVGGKIIGISSIQGQGKTRFIEEINAINLTKGITIISIKGDTHLPLQNLWNQINYKNNSRTVHEKIPLYNVIFQVLNDIAPVIISIDDFELVDDETKKFIQYLFRKIMKTKITILLTAKEKKTFESFVHQIVELKGLSKENTKQMVSSMFSNVTLSDTFIEWIHRETGGNPMLISNYILYLVGKTIKFKQGKWEIREKRLESISLPQDFQLALPTLSSTEKKVLKTASIFPDVFTLSVLEILIPEIDIVSILETLCSMEILKKREEGYYFASSLQRTTIYNKLPPEEKRRLHTLVAEFLEKEKDTKDSVLAYHFARSNIKDKGIKYSLKVARDAKKKLENEKALNYYNSAIQLMSKEEKKDVLEEYGDVLYMVSKYKLALDVYYSFITSYNLTPLEKSNIYRKIGNIYERLGEKDKAEDAYNKGIKQKRTASILRALAWLYMRKGNSKQALLLSTTALQLAQNEKDIKEIGKIYHNIGSIQLQIRNFPEAIESFKKASKIEEKIKDYTGLTATFNNLGIAYQKTGEFTKALKFYEKSLHLCEKIGKNKGIISCYKNIGNLYYQRDNITEAEKYYLKCMEIQEEIGDTAGLATSYNGLGLIFIEKGIYDTAIKYFKKCAVIRKKAKDIIGLANAYTNIGKCYIFKEEWINAKKAIQNSLRLGKKISLQTNTAFSLLNLGIIETKIGKYVHANQYFEKAKLIAKNINDISLLAKVYYQIGELNLLENNKEKALQNFNKGLELAGKEIKGSIYRGIAKTGAENSIELLEKSIKIFREIGNERELVLSLIEMGRQRKDKEAENYLKESIDIAERLGMKNEIKIAKQLLEELTSSELSTLYKVTKLINSIIDLPELLNEIMDMAIELLKAERGLLILIEENELIPQVIRGLEDETIQDATTISNSIIKDVTQRGEPIISSSAIEDERFKDRKSVKNYQIKSIICVPLRMKDKIIGTIYLDNRKIVNIFTEKHKKLLTAFADLAAVAIENSNLHQKLKEEALYLRKELEDKYYFENMVGKSPKMREVFSMIKKVSLSDVTVLIEGETGTGKELVARAIHYSGKRKEKKFVPVDCSAMPMPLLESELFGHKKGAFTGATSDKEGLFESADGGTLFIDEVGNLSHEIQTKLLRVIQEGEIRRVGDTKLRKVDVRIITASNRDLNELIKQGKFRSDLYYRLNVINIKLPPLRERKEDIPLLANHFLEKYAKKYNKIVKGFTKKAMEWLETNSWPGNIRELENCIERAIIMIERDTISLSDLSSDKKELSTLETYRLAKAKFEKSYIIKLLKTTKGNVLRAAKLADIERKGLYEAMKKHKINPNEFR